MKKKKKISPAAGIKGGKEEAISTMTQNKSLLVKTEEKSKKPLLSAVLLSDSEEEDFDNLLQESNDVLSHEEDDAEDVDSEDVEVSDRVLRAKRARSLSSADTPSSSSPAHSRNSSNSRRSNSNKHALALQQAPSEVLDPSTTVIDTRSISISQIFEANEGTTFCLRGTAFIQVKTGKIEVNGFYLTPESDQMEVFSENMHVLQSITGAENSTSFVVLTSGLSMKNGSLEPPESNSSGTPQSDVRMLQLSEEAKTFAANLYKDGNIKRPLLLCGARNTGKSTYARYLVNVLLNRYQNVAFLESDVGQSEFTPPGLVSLTIVREPLFGPPHTHQQTPACAFFIGANASNSHPRLYAQSIMQCYDHYRRFLGGQGVPLIINTQGWVTGLGLDLLHKTVKYIQPHVVEMRNNFEVLDFPGSTVLQAHARRNTPSLTAHARTLAFAAYFLPKLPSLNDVGRVLIREKPVQLDRKRTWLHALFGELREPIETFNGMLVGLCCAPSLSEPSASPVLAHLPDDALCVGLAIVRAISDEVLYLVTPANVDHVNLLVKGELGLPPFFYYSEGCPYLTPTSSLASVGGAKVMASRRNVRRRSGT